MSTPPSNAPALVLADDPRLRDTGWIGLSPAQDWELSIAGALCDVRRIGVTTHLRIRLQLKAASPLVGASRAGRRLLLVLPSAFSTEAYATVGAASAVAGTVSVLLSSLSNLTQIHVGAGTGTWAAGDSIEGVLSWTTAAPFPA